MTGKLSWPMGIGLVPHTSDNRKGNPRIERRFVRRAVFGKYL